MSPSRIPARFAPGVDRRFDDIKGGEQELIRLILSGHVLKSGEEAAFARARRRDGPEAS